MELNSTLTSLNLNSNYLKVIQPLSIKNNSTLKKLSIKKNEITDDGANFILTFFNSLTHLNFEGNLIGNNGVKLFSEALFHNSRLTKINLSNNKINTDGAKSISECLKHNSTLTSLNLSCNKIDVDGAKEISDMLKHNSILTHLYLQGIKLI
uniref:Uncharacterized protein n=1 Tax=Arcella intermedia TaxID=1963864 RepID=A0A6B2LJM9_9EUKA